jgi:hypothetical protein
MAFQLSASQRMDREIHARWERRTLGLDKPRKKIGQGGHGSPPPVDKGSHPARQVGPPVREIGGIPMVDPTRLRDG